MMSGVSCPPGYPGQHNAVGSIDFAFSRQELACPHLTAAPETPDPDVIARFEPQQIGNGWLAR